MTSYQNGESYGFTPQQINDMNQQLTQTRTQRVRAAMFPETLETGTSFPYPQLDPNNPTAVQRLSEPSQMLKQAVTGLVNYQDDADVATRAAPELTKLLNDRDPAVVARAAVMTHQLSKKEACRIAMCNSPQLIAALCGCIQTADDPQTQLNVASALHNLSKHRAGLVVIYKCGVIPLLIRLLGSSVEKVVFLSMSCLHNLLLHQEGSKVAIRQAGGVVKMTHLLKVNNAKFLALTTDCLQILAYGELETKDEIAAAGGANELVRIMSSAVYEKLLWTCSRLLKVLSVEFKCKQVIVQSGGMQILGALLNQQNKRLVSNCLWTLRNLSDASIKQENVESLIQRLVKLLASQDLNWVTCAAGILSNLTCNNSRNKTICTQVGGVEGLLRVVHQCVDNNLADVSEPAVCALRHLTARHPECENAQNSVRRHGGLPLICGLLEPPFRNWPVIKAVVGLVRNLALSAGNVDGLRQSNVITHLCSLVQYAHGVAQQQSAGGGAQSPNVDQYDGVTMDEIVEWGVGALHILARDSTNRAAIRSLGLVPTLVQILYSQHVNVTRVTCGLLNELSQDFEGARVIESEGATQPLQELIHHTDPHIASYTAAVLYNMSSDKPAEYIKRLSVDLANQFVSNRQYDDSTRNYALHDPLGIEVTDNDRVDLFGSDL